MPARKTANKRSSKGYFKQNFEWLFGSINPIWRFLWPNHELSLVNPAASFLCSRHFCHFSHDTADRQRHAARNLNPRTGSTATTVAKKRKKERMKKLSLNFCYSAFSAAFALKSEAIKLLHEARQGSEVKNRKVASCNKCPASFLGFFPTFYGQKNSAYSALKKSPSPLLPLLAWCRKPESKNLNVATKDRKKRKN